MRSVQQDVLQLQWGWITPGTGEANREEQSDAHLEFLAQPITPYTRHFLLTHCGWWLDSGASRQVRELTGRNPEPNRSVTPAAPVVVRKLAGYVSKGRLEFVVYPYAACVAEATTGEGLLRSLRMARDIARRAFKIAPRAVCNHDFVYGLDWAAVQMPQIARLLGFGLILGMDDAWVRSPDGTRVRMLGRPRMLELMQLGPCGRAPMFHPLELTQNMNWHRTLPRHRENWAALARTDFRAVTLDDYLRRVPAFRTFDSRNMGSKNWYGGTIASLLQEQNAKTMELRLPAIEALATLTGQERRVADELMDLWKMSFILMDNHTLWQCHNYQAHYLPRSFELVAQMGRMEERLLCGPARAAKKVALFNPTPWPRDLVAADGRRTYMVKAVPGWGVKTVVRSVATGGRKDRNPYVLTNDRVAFRLNSRGEVVEIRQGGHARRFDGLGALMRIHETGRPERRTLRAGRMLKLEGALCASVEVDLVGRPTDQIVFEMTGLTGEAFMLQSERLDREGRTVSTEWVLLHNLHWSGKGLPRHRMNLAPRRLSAVGATRVRLTLWMLAEGQVRVGLGRVWITDETFIAVREWDVQVHYRNGYTRPAFVDARVLNSDAVLKTVRFTGRLPDARFEMDVSLRQGSPALEYALRLHFPRPTPLGLRSPPFSAEDGSMLGAQCERPYVPGVVVLFPVGGKAKYYADKPYFIQRALTPARRTWHTDVRDWWLGMSTFIGMNLACAEWGGRQIGLCTRGLKHFFRWRRERRELLGLSLGASLIHQKTQGHSAPKSSPLYEHLKRTDHNPYFETPFLYAHGTYEFHYALALDAAGETGRVRLWKAAQEFALPPRAVPSARAQDTPGVRIVPDHVIATGLERRDGRSVLRLVNMSDRTAVARIEVSGFAPMTQRLKSWAVEEVAL